MADKINNLINTIDPDKVQCIKCDKWLDKDKQNQAVAYKDSGGFLKICHNCYMKMGLFGLSNLVKKKNKSED